MSSKNDRESVNRPVVDEKGNPFVTFRRFADEQMSSFMRGIANFPSHFFDLNSKPDRAQSFTDWEREWKQEAADFEKSLNDFFLGLDKNPQPSSESRDVRALHAKDRTDQAQQQAVAERVVSEITRSIVRDAERRKAQSHQEPVERCPYRPAGDEPYHVHPFLCDVASDGFASTMRKYYSEFETKCPENLPWNPSKNPYEEQPVKNNPPDDFDCGTGPLEPGWLEKSLNDHSDQLPPYDQWEPSPSTQLVKTGLPYTPAPAQEEVPRVISTITTTERSTLPDGTVHTKLFLKKRFANGGEESTESIYTTSGAQGQGAVQEEEFQSPPQPSLQAANSSTSSALGHDGKVKQRICDHIREKKKGGWFWS
ncbi:MAG: hypothetical protein Q9214_007354 [Letrouitia sp. 1 TL-2023]